MLRIIANILDDSITEFHLITGDYKATGAACYLNGAEIIQAARKCDEAHDAIFSRERESPLDKREASQEKRRKLADMDDELALPLLEALAKEL
jgi:hypothetical protein